MKFVGGRVVPENSVHIPLLWVEIDSEFAFLFVKKLSFDDLLFMKYLALPIQIQRPTNSETTKSDFGRII